MDVRKEVHTEEAQGAVCLGRGAGRPGESERPELRWTLACELLEQQAEGQGSKGQRECEHPGVSDFIYF